MSGIAEISKRLQNKQESAKFNFSELILKEGDQALIAIATDGNKDNDDKISDFYRHSWNDGTWHYEICKRSLDEECDRCEEGRDSQYRFGFWAYIFNITKKTAGQGDNWKEVTRGGLTVYEQTVNDYRMVSLPFGRNDVYWLQFSGIYDEHNSMNSNVVKVTRTGDGRNTVWQVTSTSKKIDWSKLPEPTDLSPVKEFYREKDEKAAQTRAVSLNQNNNNDEPPFSMEEDEKDGNGNVEEEDVNMAGLF